MNAPLYTTEILRLAASLEPPSALERIDGAADLRSPTCGSTVLTTVMIDGTGRVQALSQDVTACAFGQAAAALVDRGAIGATHDSVAGALADLTAWLTGERDDPGAWPGLDALAPARLKRGRHEAILLPLRALAAALTDRRHG